MSEQSGQTGAGYGGPAAAPPPLPTPPPTAPRTSKLPWAVAAASAVVAIVFALMWMSAQSEADDARGQLEVIEAERQAELDEANALPDLSELAEEHLSSTEVESASEDSVSVNITDGDTRGLENLLQELGFSSAIGGRIGNTRALDGTLEADGDKATATWNYHPDDGLSMVIERKE